VGSLPFFCLPSALPKTHHTTPHATPLQQACYTHPSASSCSSGTSATLCSCSFLPPVLRGGSASGLVHCSCPSLCLPAIAPCSFFSVPPYPLLLPSGPQRKEGEWRLPRISICMHLLSHCRYCMGGLIAMPTYPGKRIHPILPLEAGNAGRPALFTCMEAWSSLALLLATRWRNSGDMPCVLTVWCLLEDLLARCLCSPLASCSVISASLGLTMPRG